MQAEFPRRLYPQAQPCSTSFSHCFPITTAHLPFWGKLQEISKCPKRPNADVACPMPCEGKIDDELVLPDHLDDDMLGIRAKRQNVDVPSPVPSAHKDDHDVFFSDNLDDILLDKLADDILFGDVWRDVPAFETGPLEVSGDPKVNVVADRIRKLSL